MKLALLTGLAAALTFAGSMGARAETVYVTGPAPFVAPAYVYESPAPFVGPGFVATGRYTVVAEPRTVVIERPPAYVVEQPDWTAPPTAYRTTAGRGIEVLYRSPGSCVIDANGFERCY